jgi:hypothetical protein
MIAVYAKTVALLKSQTARKTKATPRGPVKPAEQGYIPMIKEINQSYTDVLMRYSCLDEEPCSHTLTARKRAQNVDHFIDAMIIHLPKVEAVIEASPRHALN